MSLKNKTKGLGRGLNAIFDTEDITLKDKTPVLSSTVAMISIEKIAPNPTQPRTLFDDNTLIELADSIRNLGIIQPLTLRSEDGGVYTIISGERRFRAALIIGLKEVPAYVRSVDDTTMLEMSLVENIQRQDLNAIEIAITLQRLVEECEITQESLADKVGKKRSTIANYLRLLKMPARVQLAVQEGIIHMGHAKALASIEDESKMLEYLDRVIKGNLSVRQTEEIVRIEDNSVKKTHNSRHIEPLDSYTKLSDHLKAYFGKKVSLKMNSKGGGKIVIGFKEEEEVLKLLEFFENSK